MTKKYLVFKALLNLTSQEIIQLLDRHQDCNIIENDRFAGLVVVEI